MRPQFDSGYMDTTSAPATLTKSNRTRRILRSIAKGLSLLLGFAVVGTLIAWFWYFHRTQPTSLRTELFQGVTYIRDVRKSPKANVCHIILINLKTPGLKFMVTPGDAANSRPLLADVTSNFVSKYKLQAAINADFFFPWHSTAPWDYYPHIGNSIELEGLAASSGKFYSIGTRRLNYPTLFISEKNEATFDRDAEHAYNVISGDHIFLKDGKFGKAPSNYHTSSQPRTCVALNRERSMMIWIVVDGRQPNFSEGMTMQELSAVVKQYGGTDALNLDGGGSSEMVAEGANHKPEILNSPIDCHIPGRERPVANQLGLFARPLSSHPI